jgi:uncharacterized protein involved in response to NO
VPAIIAGFLLTAVPNWTGRLPVTGGPLCLLFVIWLAGRLAVSVSALIGLWAAAVIDTLFLGALGAVVAHEIIAGKSTRNLKVLSVLALLFAGNLMFHIEVLLGAAPALATRIGISAAILLIMIVGGRIIPSFTRNWLVKRMNGRLPVPFDQIDAGIIVASTIALGFWIVAPDQSVTAAISLIAGLLNVVRLGRWAGERTLAEPLVLILHVAYGFVPLGFLLLSLGIWHPELVATSGALHSWTAGAIGLMTLAVMTRASLGHTGQALIATPGVQFIYFAATVAACARIAAAFGIIREAMLQISAMSWVLSFLGFAVIYAPHLLRSRPAKR